MIALDPERLPAVAARTMERRADEGRRGNVRPLPRRRGDDGVIEGRAAGPARPPMRSPRSPPRTAGRSLRIARRHRLPASTFAAQPSSTSRAARASTRRRNLDRTGRGSSDELWNRSTSSVPQTCNRAVRIPWNERLIRRGTTHPASSSIELLPDRNRPRRIAVATFVQSPVAEADVPVVRSSRLSVVQDDRHRRTFVKWTSNPGVRPLAEGHEAGGLACSRAT